jgi:alanyl-tRNA synthetase
VTAIVIKCEKIKRMTSTHIRQSFLKYFKQRNHSIVPSSSLVPIDDQTLLFTNAGMNQFKDTFLGKEQRPYQRATTSQKCMRVSGKHNDLENVGPSLRHHTFFEMLGNFSFGDYFKSDALPFAWDLLTKEWEIPPEKLIVTIFNGESGIPRDDEAYSVWKRLIHRDRIVELGLDENFWTMGETGPCGRCSEIHYHRGDHLPCVEHICRGVECNCDRYVEIWNIVFMEFERQTDGSLKPLSTPSIDTGMGLERIVAVLQNALSNYDTDLFTPLIQGISEVAGTGYGALGNAAGTETRDTSIRVVADHTRAMTFLIADGVLPLNEWRGYVLRKIMRRAMRHGKKLGIKEPFLYQLVDIVIDQMAGAYPELRSSQDSIVQVARHEEERFDDVLNDGLPKLEAVIADAVAATGKIDGGDVFRLYDTYGMPLDFIEDLATERKLSVDKDGFENALEQQRKQSRARQRFQTDKTLKLSCYSLEVQNRITSATDQFEGYTALQTEGVPILALFNVDREQVDELTADSTGALILERTPFYVEAGGQVSDDGFLVGDASRATVVAMERLTGFGPRVHTVRMESGVFRTKSLITATVDEAKRTATCRNHTATHLLQAVLRGVLGNHVKQAGSFVAPDRLRFDFSHLSAVAPNELVEIEQQVNTHIYANHAVTTNIRPTTEAVADGAMALFGEKYGESVRVVSVSDISKELCGGTHCQATGDIGPFVITQETGVSSGVRRIEALTGDSAVQFIQLRRQTLDQVLNRLGVPVDNTVEAIERLQQETKRLVKEVEHLKVQTAINSHSDENVDETNEVQGISIVTRRVSGLDRRSRRALADSLRSRLGTGVVILTSIDDQKVTLLVSVTKDLLDRLHAGAIVKAIAPIVGGKGGGQAELAEAGGRQPDKIAELFSESRQLIDRMLTEHKAS